MKNYPPPGDDGTVIEAIKVGDLFNKCLEKGEVPSDWKNEAIILLHNNTYVQIVNENSNKNINP